MANAVSASKRARHQGNKELERSQVPQLNRESREYHLQQAIRSYNQAVAEATQPEDWFSARKNLSWAHKIWAESRAAEADQAEVVGPHLTIDQETIFYHFLEALGEIKEVLHGGGAGPTCAAAVLGDEWVRHLIERANETYLLFLDWCLDRCMTVQAGISLMRRIYTRLPTQDLCVRCRYDEAETIFIACTREISSTGLRTVGSYKEVLSWLPDCEMPLREAAKGAAKLGNTAKVDACYSLLESVLIEICIAKAAQAIEFGDAVLKSALDNYESLNMTGVWDAIDWYHEAIVQTKEKDVENEARANSHLGVVYKDVLKSRSRAKKYFSRCMELAKTLMPRNLHGIKWFDDAAAALAAFQAESKTRCDAEAQKKKQPLLDELKDELAAVEAAASEGIGKLLEHVYAVHPPRQGGTRETSIDLKKQVLNAIRHYHPDKCKPQDTESAHDAGKWVVLCEEITKKLNFLWDTEFKGNAKEKQEV